VAFELLDGELLGELFDLRVRLGDAHAHSEALDQQHEDEEQEYQVDGRLDAQQVGEEEHDLREDADDDQQHAQTDPENGILDADARFADAADHERERADRDDYQQYAHSKGHVALGSLSIPIIHSICMILRQEQLIGDRVGVSMGNLKITNWYI
jgi:hypothetical protein